MADAGVEIQLPGTSANLGPAFDTAALAMRFYLRVRASRAGEFAIRASGRDTAICERREGNVLLKTYCGVLSAAQRNCVPLQLEIANDIPIGKGCGSSAAARLAGVLLANHFGQLGWSDEAILAEAVAREGHADNTAACWHGGVVITSGGPEDLLVTKLAVASEWPLMVAIAAEALPTRESRRVLPPHYERADVVFNLQSATLLVAALQQGRPDLLIRALQDRVHQPFRERLCPLLSALKPLAGSDGIHGVALSGAGPSVLLFLDARVPADRIRQSVSAQLERTGVAAELLTTEIEIRVPPRVTVRNPG